MSSARRNIFGKTSRGRAGTHQLGEHASDFVVGPRARLSRFRRPARRNLVRLGGGGGARLRRRPTPRARARILVGRFGARGWMSWAAALKVDAPAAPSAPDAPAPASDARTTRVVVDTNAIVKGFRLERFAEEAVTIPEILREVKDLQAKHTLATLPFELKVLDPDEASVAAVRRCARLTGDLGALSEPDLRVVALAYMLERDAHVVGRAAVRRERQLYVREGGKGRNNRDTRGGDQVITPEKGSTVIRGHT